MPTPDTSAAPLSPAALLALLRRHGGREYRAAAQLAVRERATKRGAAKASTPDAFKGQYLLTARGERVRAVGPSGRASELSEAEFLDIFGRYLFADVQTTGVLTDLGPLFG
ncbi:hypothetical protein MF271_10315 [Deinococcus sp. KNUC1210]|uniref:hypothetical protein n=1 Tax=Deinococcus sp. KNUC1210 TaxID=2917691 RepID=UPI001EF01272|nr:hypothetical protein [Deinococcus sp. KNUC1210]ULH14429.1 hypothetical protein MF271_10315 [Deinococcus sp. KNUC1210]